MKLSIGVLVVVVVAFAGCKPDDMADQVKIKPMARSGVYADGAAARPLVPHSVDRAGRATGDDQAIAWSHALPADATYPFVVTAADLARGQQRFTIYCTPCHGQVGDGAGMIPQRGFSRPPTYHSDRLRAAPDAYFYNVISNGIGAMYSYSESITPEDRWRIVAYIRALQLSQHATVADMPPATAPASAGTMGSVEGKP